MNRFRLRRPVNRARPPQHRHLAAKTSPSIHSDSHSLGVWERGFTILAGAIHTFRGSIHDLVHTFWQGIGSFGEVLTDFAIPTQDFAKPCSPTMPRSSPTGLCVLTSLTGSALRAHLPYSGKFVFLFNPLLLHSLNNSLFSSHILTTSRFAD